MKYLHAMLRVGDLEKSLKFYCEGPGETPSGKLKMAFVDDPDGYEIGLLEG